MLDDTSNKDNKNVLIMKPLTTKGNSIPWVSKKGNHAYPRMATFTSMTLKMVFMMKHITTLKHGKYDYTHDWVCSHKCHSW
jgi:hypothetical protein